eukprot:2662832-Amphidinium_carterae.1
MGRLKALRACTLKSYIHDHVTLHCQIFPPRPGFYLTPKALGSAMWQQRSALLLTAETITTDTLAIKYQTECNGIVLMNLSYVATDILKRGLLDSVRARVLTHCHLAQALLSLDQSAGSE